MLRNTIVKEKEGTKFPFLTTNCLLIGPPGSGKTYAIKEFLLSRYGNHFIMLYDGMKYAYDDILDNDEKNDKLMNESENGLFSFIETVYSVAKSLQSDYRQFEGGVIFLDHIDVRMDLLTIYEVKCIHNRVQQLNAMNVFVTIATQNEEDVKFITDTGFKRYYATRKH